MTNSVQQQYSPKDLQMVLYKAPPKAHPIDELQAVKYLMNTLETIQSANKYIGRAYIVYQVADFAYSVYSGKILVTGGVEVGKFILKKAVKNPNSSYLQKGFLIGKSSFKKIGISSLSMSSVSKIGTFILKKSKKHGYFSRCISDCYNDSMAGSMDHAKTMKQCMISCGLMSIFKYFF